ncbi:amidase [Amycolatopsis sp. 195334CR]|uniref:amidase n=1 Tax=Amycolatopsis sp. 195334CR TaxID=2814588 RepID=UPI001A8FF41B|nr:amidase [Amycolatopsis sp. 195334CR]MBN6038973.1 amidase [Amycolatopsis sp. 195334CR]
MNSDVTDAATALRQGETSSVALVTEALAVEDELGVYRTRFPESALAAARRADAELAIGRDRGPLHGIPFGVKDLIAVAEGPTTAQSLVLGDGWGTGIDATAVTRLKAAGAVIIGKTSTMEFGCGVPDPAKPFPAPRNPWDPDRWAGGSSSGTAAGVAAGMFPAGLGTDTAGSIRMPAAFCGITGLMPTYGRVPADGCLPLARSLDRIGPLARTARDCALVFEVLTGTPLALPETPDLTGLRIGVVREHHFPDDADPALPDVFETALAVLADLGAALTEVRLPQWAELSGAVLLTACCEGFAEHQDDLLARWADFHRSTRGFLAGGAMVSGAGYVRAQRVREVARRALAELFEEVDVVAGPTASIGAPYLDEVSDEAGQQNPAVFGKVNTPYWNGVGNPVLAVPMGTTADGLPLSLQLAGDLFAEELLLRTADAYQRACRPARAWKAGQSSSPSSCGQSSRPRR